VTNLLIDIGNTSVKASYANGMKLEEPIRYEGGDLHSFILGLAKQKKVKTIAISSVRVEEGASFSYLESECDRLIVVDGGIKSPIINRYKRPELLGSDRILAAIAVNFLFPGEDALIFDFGTALTIDFLTKNGEFEGGNISPGIKSRFKSLNDNTQRLPLLNTPNRIVSIGTDTQEAIENGVILGLIFEVEGYIEKYPNYKYIFSGGDAIYFAERVKSSIFVVYNLVLIGLARMAEYYAKEI